VPGPAAYNINNSYVDRASAAFSLRPKSTYASMFNDPTRKNPGPGYYDPSRALENKNGFTLSSKFKSSGAAVISKTGKRFDNRDMRRSMEIPGPG
jgi:quinol monooxygenase YgiN